MNMLRTFTSVTWLASWNSDFRLTRYSDKAMHAPRWLCTRPDDDPSTRLYPSFRADQTQAQGTQQKGRWVPTSSPGVYKLSVTTLSPFASSYHEPNIYPSLYHKINYTKAPKHNLATAHINIMSPVKGSEENDHSKPGEITEKLAKDPSSKTPSTASSHPAHQNTATTAEDQSKVGDKVQFRDHQAAPGPAIMDPKEINVQMEGTREERDKKAAELNK